MLNARIPEYDSGERDMRSVLSAGYTAALFTMQRVGRLVTITFEDLVTPGGTGFAVTASTGLPAGFRPTGERNFSATSGSGVGVRCRVRLSGIAVNQATAGTAYSGTVTYLVPLALPTTLPGTPA